MIKRIVASIICAAVSQTFAIAPAQGQTEDGSLDTLWNDHSTAAEQSKSSSKSSTRSSSSGQKNKESTAKEASSPRTRDLEAKASSSRARDLEAGGEATTSAATDSSAGQASSTGIAANENNAPSSGGSSSGGSSGGSSSAGDLSAPLCTLDRFRSSEFVQKGGWPGIGPFQPTLREPNELKDSSDNLLRLTVSNQKVTGAELMLVKQPSSNSGFLNLEMTADYFLEALGAKPGKISEFNASLEKSRTQLSSGDTEPVSLSAGNYHVSISPAQDEDLTKYIPNTKEKLALVIKVNSKDASPSAIREHSTTPVETSTAAPPDTIPVASAAQPPAVSPTKTAPTTSTAPARTSAVPARTSAAAATAKQSETPAKTGKPSSAEEALKNKFTELLTTWASIKKNAVRNCVTGELPEVLYGKALQRQADSIKWLSNNKKYYEMIPKGVTVSKIQDLFMSKKYACFAQVKELRKYIDGTNGKLIKESDDTYDVNYTIEKVNDRWYISDSEVLKSDDPKAAAQPKTR